MIIWATHTSDPSWKALSAVTVPLWREFADTVGHDLHIDISDHDPAYHHSFHKMDKLRRFLAANPAELVMAIDLDIIPTFIKKGAYWTGYLNGENTGIPTNGKLVYQKDINGINSGVMMLGYGPKEMMWLRAIHALRSVCSSEQHAMWLLHEAFWADGNIIPQPFFNSIPYDEYPDYGEKSEFEGQWKPGHFTCHLPGMTNERRIELFTQKYIPQIVR
jgi:hypothetical protein